MDRVESGSMDYSISVYVVLLSLHTYSSRGFDIP